MVWGRSFGNKQSILHHRGSDPDEEAEEEEQQGGAELEGGGAVLTLRIWNKKTPVLPTPSLGGYKIPQILETLSLGGAKPGASAPVSTPKIWQTEKEHDYQATGQ